MITFQYETADNTSRKLIHNPAFRSFTDFVKYPSGFPAFPFMSMLTKMLEITG